MEIRIRDFLLREWRRGDEEALVRHANNPNVSRNLREIFPHPYTPDDAIRWIAHASTKKPTTDFAIVVDGEAAGGIGSCRWTTSRAGLLKSATGLARPTGATGS
jgi:RimJ/RimL family protein N-acetyltransferase